MGFNSGFKGLMLGYEKKRSFTSKPTSTDTPKRKDPTCNELTITHESMGEERVELHAFDTILT